MKESWIATVDLLAFALYILHVGIGPWGLRSASRPEIGSGKPSLFLFQSVEATVFYSDPAPFFFIQA